MERQETDKDGITVLIGLLHQAFEMEVEQVTAMINFVQLPQQTAKTEHELAVRVGKANVVVPAGKTVCVHSVHPNFDTTDPLVLYEVSRREYCSGATECGRRAPGN